MDDEEFHALMARWFAQANEERARRGMPAISPEDQQALIPEQRNHR